MNDMNRRSFLAALGLAAVAASAAPVPNNHLEVACSVTPIVAAGIYPVDLDSLCVGYGQVMEGIAHGTDSR